jgi:hypothetical protein
MWVKKTGNKIKRYVNLPKYYKHWSGGFPEEAIAVHEAEGFFKVPDAVFNPETQYLGEIVETGLNTYEWDIIDKPAPVLAELQAEHIAIIVDVMTEMTGITSIVKNIHDPLNRGTSVFPAGLQELVIQILPIRDTAYSEIDALSTVLDAQNYVARTTTMEDLIVALKTFI